MDQENISPLLSIIIPTKNRYETLIPVLNALLEHIVKDNYEIVVQDNSDDTEPIVRWLSVSGDNRIKYFYKKDDLSVSENSSLAIDNCQGEYVIFIGDDDFVSPYICDVVKNMKELQIDCLTYAPGNYYWKGVSFKKRSYLLQCQTLYLPHRIYNNLLKKNALTELVKVLNAGAVSIDTLPKIYHGIVKKKVLDQIKRQWGSYFPGASPDMASSVALSLILDNFYYISYPLSVTGVSVKSAAGLGAKRAHVGKIEDQKYLPKNTLQNWNIKVPKIWTGPSIYAQTATEVLGNNLPYVINYFALYAYMLAYHADLKEYIKEARRNVGLSDMIQKRTIFYYQIQIFLKRVLSRIKRTIGIYPLRGYNNMDSVEICMKFLKDYLKDKT